MTPNVRAWFLVNFPVGIGLRQVLVINESKSDSYHMFKAPAAPEPSATAKREKNAFANPILAGAISKPTAQVKITNDITLGFIKLKKAFK